MRIPRPIVRRAARYAVNLCSLNILETATESLTESMHNVEIAADIREYNAVNIE